MKLQISLSAIPLAKIKRMMREIPADAIRAYDKIFNKLGEGKGKNKFRIYLPLTQRDLHSPKVEPPQEILNYLSENRYTLDNYLLGTSIMPDGKRTVRLGRVLAQKPELLRMFENDPQRKLVRHEKMWVVISRHPYDVLGMSFDRGWTSCMDLEEGSNRHYLEGDQKQGTIVAYLVKDNDKNINAPTSRIAIRPYRKGEHTMFVPSGTYGTDSEAFKAIVHKFCEKLNEGLPDGAYRLPHDLYDDGEGETIVKVGEAGIANFSDEECLELSRQGHIEPHIVEQLVDRGLSECFLRLLKRFSASMPVSTLMKIARHPDAGRAHHWLITRKETPVEVLKVFAENDDADVRMAVAESCSNEAIRSILANDSVMEVRAEVAISTTNPDTMLKLANDLEEKVVISVIRNEHVTQNIVKEIVTRFPTEAVLRRVIGRHNMPLDFLLPYLYKNINSPLICNYASQNEEMPAEALTKIFEAASNFKDEEDHDDGVDVEYIMRNLCDNQNTPLDVVFKIVTMSRYSVARAIMNRSDKTEELIDMVFKYHPENTRALTHILNREVIDEEILRTILLSENKDAAAIAIDSGKVSQSMFQFYLENASNDSLKNTALAINLNRNSDLAYAFVRTVKYSPALRELVEYNGTVNWTPEFFKTVWENPAAHRPSIEYAMYAIIPLEWFAEVRSLFNGLEDRLNDYANNDGRYVLSELDEQRERRYRRRKEKEEAQREREKVVEPPNEFERMFDDPPPTPPREDGMWPGT